MLAFVVPQPKVSSFIMGSPLCLSKADFIHVLLTGLAEQDRIRSLEWPQDRTIRAVRAAMAACQEEGIKLESDLAASVTQAMVGILIGIGEHDRRLIQYRDPKQLTIQHHELGAWKNRSPVSALVRQRMAAAFDQAYHHRTTH